jgi:hypothetical protein
MLMPQKNRKDSSCGNDMPSQPSEGEAPSDGTKTARILKIALPPIQA